MVNPASPSQSNRNRATLVACVAAIGLMRPQSTNRAGAYSLQEVQTWRTIQKPSLFTTLRHNLRKQVDHAVIRSVDTAGNIR